MQAKEKINVKEVSELTLDYLLYEPKNRVNEKMPLIVFLHGAGERGNDLEAVKSNCLPKILDDEKELNCIVVSPQCPENTSWAFNISKVKVFIEEMIKRYNIDEDRVYLTGISMGGYGTWFTAMAYPNMFAAIVPVCGGGMPWNAVTLTMPVWAFHGALDDCVCLYESETMVNSINKHYPNNAKLTIYPDVGHNAWDYTYSRELLNWLLSQKRK